MDRFPAQLTVDDSTLVLDQTRLLVVFDEQMDREDVEEMLEPFDLRLEELDESRQGEGPTTPTIGSTVNHSPTSYWVRADEEIDEDVLEALDDERDVAYVSPVFGDPDDTRVTSRFSLDPTVLLVRLDPDREDEDEDDTADRLSRLANEQGLTYDPADDEHLEPFHFLRLSDGADDRHVFDIRERLDDERDVHTVTYNTIPLASPLTQPEPVVPNDTHFADQWNMTQIEASVGDESLVFREIEYDRSVVDAHPHILDVVSVHRARVARSLYVCSGIVRRIRLHVSNAGGRTPRTPTGGEKQPPRAVVQSVERISSACCLSWRRIRTRC
jgi:hypothetical protein